jgi:hypothetical protein
MIGTILHAYIILQIMTIIIIKTTYIILIIDVNLITIYQN